MSNRTEFILSDKDREKVRKWIDKQVAKYDRPNTDGRFVFSFRPGNLTSIWVKDSLTGDHFHLYPPSRED